MSLEGRPNAAGAETQELLAALARSEELVVLPRRRYNALVSAIAELRERVQDGHDIRLLDRIDQDAKQSWVPLDDVLAQLQSEGLLDAV
jgi:ATP:corrinoid adenosyltransferase